MAAFHPTQTPGSAPGAIQVRPGSWEFTLQGGAGFSLYYGDQAADPAFGFTAGRFLSDSMQAETQLLVMPAPVREHSWERRDLVSGDVISTGWSRARRQMYVALTRINLHLGEGNVRPYLSFGAGLGWGSERVESWSRCLDLRCDPDPPVRIHGREGLALATLLGSGVDVELDERWRLRPEVVMPYLWGAPQPGYVSVIVGATYAPRRSGSSRSPRQPSIPGTAPGTGWDRVVALPLGEAIRVQVRRGINATRDGELGAPPARILTARFVAADAAALELRIPEGADAAGIWRIPRLLVERVERGHVQRDGPWEGVLGGFVVGAGIGAFGYLSSSGGDDSEIWLPAGTILFGGPAALLGGLGDYAHRSFEPGEVVYDSRAGADAPGSGGSARRRGKR